MARNIRRVGVPATIKGKLNPDYMAVVGVPTAERLAKAQSHFTIGDDKQGTRIYHFHDSTLDRLYSRLARRAKTRGEEETVRSEYISLQRYKHHWYHGGLELALGSMDLNRVFASDPSSMSGMPKSERQAHHRKQYREARDLLGHRSGIVVDNLVCYGNPIEFSGYALGYTSVIRARQAAVVLLRESARMLAKHWGIG